MKRFMTILLTIVLISMAMASADSLIDLTKYSDSQLKEILFLVNQEMVDRKIVKQAKVPVGQYTVGPDIPAGKYEISEQEVSTIMGPFIQVYSNRDEKTPKKEFSYIMNPAETIVVELKNGYFFETNQPIILKIFTGISFE